MRRSTSLFTAASVTVTESTSARATINLFSTRLCRILHLRSGGRGLPAARAHFLPIYQLHIGAQHNLVVHFHDNAIEQLLPFGAADAQLGPGGGREAQ